MAKKKKTLKKKKLKNVKKGRHARRKGHQFERNMANIFKENGFPDAKRHLEYQSEEAAEGVDLDNTGKLKIQLKKYKRYVNPSHIEEVTCDELLGEIPVLITAADNKPAIACVKLDDFLFLIRNNKKVK